VPEGEDLQFFFLWGDPIEEEVADPWKQDPPDPFQPPSFGRHANAGLSRSAVVEKVF
jgi:hypothetical protein